MGGIIFILILFVVLVGGGWYIGRSIGGALERRINEPDSSSRSTYIDKSVNFHTHHHTHQNLTVIDEETHKKGLGYFSDKKESRNE